MLRLFGIILLIFGTLAPTAYALGVFDASNPLTGTIQVLPLTGVAGNWRVSGRLVRVGDPAIVQQNLGPASVGGCVLITGQIEVDDSVTATGVQVTSSSAGCAADTPPTSFYGMVQKMPADGGLLGNWQISGRTVQVVAGTAVDTDNFNAVVGGCSQVTGTAAADGSFNAVLIEMRSSACGDDWNYRDDWLQVVDVVDATSPTGLVGTWDLNGRPLKITAATQVNRVAGEVAVGACLDAQGRLLADGSLNAATVVVKTAADCAKPVAILDTVGQARQQLFGTDEYGDWYIGNTLVHISPPATALDYQYGRLVMGACVEAKGQLQADGSLAASLVAVKAVSGTCVTPHGAVSAASMQTGKVAPGEMVSMLGFGLGPVFPAGLALGPDGRVATSNGNLRVLFDGVPAPLVSATMNRVSAVVPWEVAGQTSTQVQVYSNGVWSNSTVLPVVSAQPGLFTADGSGLGQAIARNQDMTVNTAATPAAKGSIVAVYGTGAGLFDRAVADGDIIVDSSTRTLLPVTATVGGIPTDVLFAGAEPSAVAGTLQVNLRIPDAAPTGIAVPVVIRVGLTASQTGVTLAVR